MPFNAAARGSAAAIEQALADSEVRALLIAANGLVFRCRWRSGRTAAMAFCQQQLEQDTNRCCCRSPMPEAGDRRDPGHCRRHRRLARHGLGDLNLMADNASLYLPFSQLG